MHHTSQVARWSSHVTHLTPPGRPPTVSPSRWILLPPCSPSVTGRPWSRHTSTRRDSPDPSILPVLLPPPARRSRAEALTLQRAPWPRARDHKGDSPEKGWTVQWQGSTCTVHGWGNTEDGSTLEGGGPVGRWRPGHPLLPPPPAPRPSCWTHPLLRAQPRAQCWSPAAPDVDQQY